MKGRWRIQEKEWHFVTADKLHLFGIRVYYYILQAMILKLVLVSIMTQLLFLKEKQKQLDKNRLKLWQLNILR